MIVSYGGNLGAGLGPKEQALKERKQGMRVASRSPSLGESPYKRALYKSQIFFLGCTGSSLWYLGFL